MIVNSGLRLMKARVPSSGSTRKNASSVAGVRPAATSSSAMTGHARRGAVQPGDQHLLGLVVGDGDGRRVGLGLDRDAGRKVAPSRSAPRPARQGSSASTRGRYSSSLMRRVRLLIRTRGPARRRAAARGACRAARPHKTQWRAAAGRPLHRKSGACIRRQEHFASGPCSLRSGIPALVGTVMPLRRSDLRHHKGASMGQRANPTDLELAALISSKICHDVIGPVGAIYNGLEILDEDDDEEAKNYALDVIRNVTEQASARLQFARFAFGAAGSAGAMIDLGTAEQISRGFIGKGKHNLIWRTVPGHMGKDKVKLLLNLVASAITALPRGGEIEVQMGGSLENPSFLIRCRGTERAPAAAPRRVHRRRAPAAARCHDHPGLLHVAAGQHGRHAPRRAAGRRRRPPVRQAAGVRRIAARLDLGAALLIWRRQAEQRRLATGAVAIRLVSNLEHESRNPCCASNNCRSPRCRL